VDLSVVVPSHDRPLRLRWLLNCLAEQTLAAERWELIVVHDSRGDETDELLREHPLRNAVRVDVVALPAGSAAAAAKRNIGWRRARGSAVVFTDDDCQPPPEWLERAWAAVRRHPGAVVQGMTGPHPVELNVVGKHAPYIHTISVAPPQPWGQTCNIIYPRSVLEASRGFPEDMTVGEDTALAETARALGVDYVPASEVITFHAVEEVSFAKLIRGAWRWRDMPLLVARHPRLRQDLPLYVFWKREHAMLPLAGVGLWLLRRSRLAGLLTVPYLVHVTPKKHGHHPRARIRALLEVPGWTGLYVAEFLTLAWGSLKHRKLLL
jgi:glycosyltransferase involved in cell wall biosynthesis